MVALNQALSFYNALSELQQAELLDYTVIRHYEAGEYLEMRPGLYIVGDGGITACSAHESGKRRTAFVAHWMESMLLTPSFLAQSRLFSLGLYAREVSEIWFIPYKEWCDVEEWKREIREFSTGLLSKQMSRLVFTLYTQMEKNIAKRLAMFLLYINDTSSNAGNGILPLSHEELADLTGTTREAVTRNLNILKESGLIQTGRHKIKILNTAALRGYANLQPEFELEDPDEKICQLYFSDVHGTRHSLRRGG